MLYPRPRSSNYPASLLLVLIGLSFSVMFLPTPPESSSRRINNKLGPRLLSPLLPGGNKNNKVPVVIQFKDPLTLEDLQNLEALGVHFRQVGSVPLHANRIYPVKIPYSLLTDSNFLTQIHRIEYAGRYLRPQLDDSVPHVNASKAWNLRLPDNTSVTGKGVTIGVIDTGIDWKHPAFYFADGPIAEIRLGSDDGWFFADLNGDGGFQSSEDLEVLDETFDGRDALYKRRVDWLFQDINGNNRFEFGSEHRFLLRDVDGDSTISEGDQAVGLGTCKINKIWDQTDHNRLYVRGVNLTLPSVNRETDLEHHGTHVAGILVGGQLGFERRFVGVAPGAELLVIKTDYEEANVIAGIQWLVHEQADVILMSLGGTTGYFLDGSSLLEQTVDAAGIPVVISAGNEGSFNRHVRTFIESGFGKRRAIPLDVVKPATGTLSTVYLSVLWREPENPLRIYLQSPSSSMTELSGQEGATRVGKNSISYERSESDRGTVLFDIEITRAGNVEPGTWTLTLENQRDFAQIIHCWVETEDVSSTKFLKWATDQFTMTNPATADSAIAVVSYNYITGILSYFSSQGPRIDGALKPWVVAPGEAITSPVSGTWSHTDFTGASAAAPHVAGTITLMLQVDPTATREQIRTRLAQGAKTDRHTEDFKPTPNSMWGHGKVDAFCSVLLPPPVILDVQLGETSLQNASHSTVYHGEYPLTFTIHDATLFAQNMTVQLEITELTGNQTTPPQEYLLTKIADDWGTTLSCQLNTTYILNFTAQDPLFNSSFITTLTGVAPPPESACSACPEPSGETTSSLPSPEVPEFVFPPSEGFPTMHRHKANATLVALWVVLTVPLAIQLIQRRRTRKTQGD